MTVSFLVPLLAWAFTVAAQSSDAALIIITPEDGSYVTGSVTLKAAVDDPGAKVVRLTFFADGKMVCEVDSPPYECVWDAGTSVREHQIRVVALLEDGRRLRRNIRTKSAGYTESVDVDVVQVTATVTDGSGRFVRGLARNEFRVLEDKVPQRITHFAAENVPLELVVAIDISDSMARAMPAVKAAVKKFLAAIPESNQVTLVGFNNNILTLARREASPAVRARAVDRLQPWGGTALYDVIARSIDQLGREQGRRALVIFTDGDDQSSHVSLEDVERRVDASDATLYLVGQGRAQHHPELRRILDRLATISGGRTLYPEGDTGLEKTFAEIVEELSNQYLLVYPPANVVRDDSWREIAVELTDSRYRVRARKGYRATRRSPR
jgi:VWFA-related protein